MSGTTGAAAAAAGSPVMATRRWRTAASSPPTPASQYGTHYIQRALVTAIGLGANRPQVAIYPTSTVPDIVKKYDGAEVYETRFEKSQLPPVDGFWSLKMRDKDDCFVDNPLNR